MTRNFRLSSLSAVMVSVILAPFLLRPTVDMIDIPPGGEILRFSDARGPESVAFDSHGRGPYVSVEDGRIMRWNGGGEGWSDFATTRPRRKECDRPTGPEEEDICGRPLGLRFDEKTGNLYIADAYFGLLVVGPHGGAAEHVVASVDGSHFNFTNHLDIDHGNGFVYFTDSSANYPRRKFFSALISSDNTGRVMKYDIKTKQTTVLLDKMAIPNGLALGKDGSFLLVAESGTCRIVKLWLKTEKAGTSEVILHLPGFPDNIRRSPSGDFWVAIFAKRRKIDKWLLKHPWFGRTFLKVYPFSVEKLYWLVAKRIGSESLALRITEDGKILKTLPDQGGATLRFVTEVEEHNGRLYFGSLVKPYVYVI